MIHTYQRVLYHSKNTFQLNYLCLDNWISNRSQKKDSWHSFFGFMQTNLKTQPRSQCWEHRTFFSPFFSNTFSWTSSRIFWVSAARPQSRSEYFCSQALRSLNKSKKETDLLQLVFGEKQSSLSFNKKNKQRKYLDELWMFLILK